MTAPDCPDPAGCPVPTPPGPVEARELRLVEWPAGRPFHRVYRVRHGVDEFNPGVGDTRFAPLVDDVPVPTLYGGEDETVALLESVFHDVTLGADRIIYRTMLRERGLAHLAAPRELQLIDLRDEALAELESHSAPDRHERSGPLPVHASVESLVAYATTC